MNRVDRKECAEVLKALRNGVRLNILEWLFNNVALSVRKIANPLGTTHSRASHHWSIMRNAGLVVADRKGQFVIYKIDPKSFKKDQET